MIKVTTDVRLIRKGDRFVDPETGKLVWEALEDAERRDDGHAVLVQHFPDRGTSRRFWWTADGAPEITVEREEGAPDDPDGVAAARGQRPHVDGEGQEIHDA